SGRRGTSARHSRASARLSLVRAVRRRAGSGDELWLRQLRAVYGDRVWHWRFVRAEHYVSAAGAECAQKEKLATDGAPRSCGGKKFAVAKNACPVSPLMDHHRFC